MNKIIQPLVKELQENAKTYVNADLINPLDFTGYQLYLDTGNRLAFEKQYFSRRRELDALALSYYIEKDQKVKQLLEKVIWEVCNEYAWGLPAHMPITDKTLGSASPQWLDLFAAETGETLAEIQELIGDDLAPQINKRINQEIERRILQPFEAHDWDWQYKKNNWSAVIGGCVGITALIKLPAHSQRQKEILKRLKIAFDSYLSSFGDDGACVEGVSYWAYGFGYYIYFSEKLREVLNDNSLLDLPKVRLIAEFPYHTELAENQFVPFSDAAQSELPTGLLSFCHKYFKVKIPTFDQINPLDFDDCYRFAQLYRNLIWTTDSAHQSIVTEKIHYFKDVQWLIQTSEEHDFVFAAKGGRNDESHNHIDLGHFIFGDKTKLYLTDLGAGEYTKDYFTDSLRYQYLTTAATGHSIPVINGQLQVAGNHQSIGRFDQNTGIFSLDLTETYQTQARLQKFNRSFLSDSNNRSVKITDTFKFSKKENQITESFITKVKPQISNQQVILGTNSKGCLLEFETSRLTVKNLTYSDHDGHPQKFYRIEAEYTAPKDTIVNVKISLY